MVQRTVARRPTPSTRRSRPNSESTWRQAPHGAAGGSASRHDDRATEPLGARRHRGAHRRPLGADGEAVRGVLDVAADEHAAVLRLERAARRWNRE